MSRGFVKDGDQEEVPMVPPRAFLPNGVVNYVTSEGINQLQREKSDLLSAREKISGNETDVRVTRNFINAKLDLLEERIRSAVVIDAKGQPEGKVCFGAYVTLRMGGSGMTRVVRITGADEADVSKGFISYFSPLAVAISGHRVGDRIEVALPGGVRKVTIVSISYTYEAPQKKEALPVIVEDKSITPSGNEIVAKEDTACDDSANDENTASVAVTSKEVELPPTENANEIFPIVNERGVTIGRAARWQCHSGSKLLHPVVHLHVFNSNGELFLQKRPLWKDIQPGKWDTSVGGHIAFGEKVESALRRETMEELGFENFTPLFLKRYVFESSREKELVHVYRTLYDGVIAPSAELNGGRFWKKEEISENLGKKVFTPNFESEYKLFFK